MDIVSYQMKQLIRIEGQNPIQRIFVSSNPHGLNRFRTTHRPTLSTLSSFVLSRSFNELTLHHRSFQIGIRSHLTSRDFVDNVDSWCSQSVTDDDPPSLSYPFFSLLGVMSVEDPYPHDLLLLLSGKISYLRYPSIPGY